MCEESTSLPAGQPVAGQEPSSSRDRDETRAGERLDGPTRGDGLPRSHPADGVSPAPDDMTRRRLLVVEDDPLSLELLVECLRALECQVETATSGLGAIEMIRAHPPDVILLDIMMPKMSGFEVCTKLKNDPRTREIPVIMITALSEMGDIRKGVECGADDLVLKPYGRLDLLARVRSLLGVRHLKDELDRALAHIDNTDARPCGRCGKSGP